MPHVGLHETDFAAIAFQAAIERANLHVQLRFAFILERCQQRQHLLVFSDFWGVKYALTFPVRVRDFLLQVDRDQLVVHQFHLAVTELKVRTTNVFTPLVSLNNPDTVLPVWRTWRARHVIHLFFILRRHAYRIL